jgi:hypothetical protein
MPKPHPTSTASVREVSTALVARASEAAVDPMRRMWDALEAAGCKPHGEPHKFRACCPAHQGSNSDALEVYEGVDRRVVFGCYARRCEKSSILDAIGLRWSDVFPPGSRKAGKQQPRPVKALSKGAAFLDAMTLAGYRWHAQLLGVECPYCSDPNAYLTVHDAGGLDVKCPNLCTERNVREAVETRAAIAEKLKDERRAA